jgi:hypothetical protein
MCEDSGLLLVISLWRLKVWCPQVIRGPAYHNVVLLLKKWKRKSQQTMKPLGFMVVIAVRWDKPQAANDEGCKLMPVYEV